jgi:hypothetical protein
MRCVLLPYIRVKNGRRPVEVSKNAIEHFSLEKSEHGRLPILLESPASRNLLSDHPLVLVAVLIKLFPDGNFNMQAVSRQGKRAGGEGIVGARRIVGLVEIQFDGAILGNLGIQKT